MFIAIVFFKNYRLFINKTERVYTTKKAKVLDYKNRSMIASVTLKI